MNNISERPKVNFIVSQSFCKFCKNSFLAILPRHFVLHSYTHSLTLTVRVGFRCYPFNTLIPKTQTLLSSSSERYPVRPLFRYTTLNRSSLLLGGKYT